VTDPAGPDFATSVTRPDDLLVLSFGGYNLRLDTPAGQTARLVRVTAGQPAFLIVQLPPQHIAEQASGASPAAAVMAGPTRLAFRLADDTDHLDFTLRDLLDWSHLVPSVTANATTDGPGDGTVLPPKQPAPTETLIELPYRLQLSPDATGGWSHSADAVTRGPVTELWQTRLGVRQPDGNDDTQLPVLRAVWTRDLPPGATGLVPPPEDNELTGTTLSGFERIGIVSLSSFFGQDVLLLNPVRDPLPYDPPPLQATHLTLSALGGWTDIRGDWDFPEDPDQVYPNQAPPGGSASVSVVAWRQVVAQGRDQYVRIVTRGYLYPLGHRADRVEVYERKLDDTGVSDRLVRTETVVVREAYRDYRPLSASHPADHALPVRTARIQTLVTPPQLPQAADAAATVFGTDEQPMLFHVTGEDWSGQPVELRMPLAFVPDHPSNDPDGVYRPTSQVDLGGQAMTLAARAGMAARLPVQLLEFTAAAQGDSCLPYVRSAQVSIPAISHLTGSVTGALATSWITLTDPETTAGQVFAQLVQPDANGVLSAITLPVTLPPQRGGGLARPSVAIGALSRTLGVVPPDLGDLATMKDRLFADLNAAKLLGTISLRDVIKAITSPDQVPKLLQQQTPAGVDIGFEWTIPVQSFGPFVAQAGASLALSTHLRVPAGPGASGPPQCSVHGTLTSFAINFLDVVQVGFTSVEFRSEHGQPVTVRPTGVRVQLREELEFLNALADIMPADGFSDGPTVKVTPRGVTAGYSLGLPSAGIGIFSLEQVAMSAGVTLPFDGTPAAVRLAFSERAHPFLVTVAMIGGAGFFAIEVNTDGVQRIEGSIEVGANMTVDLAIVSANVHVMAGFYFGLARVNGQASVDFSAYLRIGGSVELLGIAGVSVDITLSMTLEKSGGKPASIGGRAAVVVSVHLLMFRKSVSLSTEKHFAIAANDPSFDDLVSADDWETYCRAFA
jgi:hypothetical protein